ncbi:hypothetical protein Syn7502_01028 [Synechococcus sp. PCC 7502]|uniref:hypothetical protein n=1 Tax=Synechococcus sp. PCC 7502 TaxID=1173263 RepID=UPI00029FB8C1|nr:hypothetical protein [Synechococcus sp. PCC 7502]AFY73139.1 hypothetical protein Syn7502_01028 [Synechococcus sp. PCC 7502]
MAQSSILELAKQGDGDAIATLINRSIQAKGITATANLDHACLHIDLRSPQKINQKAMVSLIRKGMLSLQVKTIQELEISAYLSDYETASDQLIWEIHLHLESSEVALEPNSAIALNENKGESKNAIPDPIPPTQIPNQISTDATVTALTVHQPVQIKHIPQSYQDIIIRFTDPLYGHIKCLCTLTELVQVINNFSFGSANPALKNLLEAIAESTTIDQNGDRIINNISVLQPGSQWQKAKIRLVVNIFFESEGYVPPTDTNINSNTDVITLEAAPIEEKPEPAKTPKQILLEDLSSLLSDIGKSEPTEPLASKSEAPESDNDVMTLDELSKVW